MRCSAEKVQHFNMITRQILPHALLAFSFFPHGLGTRDGSTQQPLGPIGVPLQDETTISQDVSANYTCLLETLHTMQSHYFSITHGVWPDAIDWTSAVMGTQVSATLSCISGFLPSNPTIAEVSDHENVINRYFSQLSTFYFGENAFGLRNQAYDDMLWVVLDWLEAIQFIERHSLLYTPDTSSEKHSDGKHDGREGQWYARQFIPQFAHRARIFYDLASQGWDTTLCDGGMFWSPYGSPYKNAITNQLFISASVSMYLHFPGDKSDAPFLASTTSPPPQEEPTKTSKKHKSKDDPAAAHDRKYLDNAIRAHDWLASSGMRNHQGLYVDGFHIRGWRGGRHRSNGTRQCDVRNEMVYTYNQGVILTGLRGLWQATGNTSYLQEGHELIADVIAATGWHERDSPRRWFWAGLGRNGVLEEACDWGGGCSQNGQTFKGIFFHHFGVFCAALPDEEDRGEGDVIAEMGKMPWLGKDGEEVRALHRKQCLGYRDWVDRNALAALVTRDKNGEVGEWWGRDASNNNEDDGDAVPDEELERPNFEGTDYRNRGVPRNVVWVIGNDDDDVYDEEGEGKADGNGNENEKRLLDAMTTAERLGLDLEQWTRMEKDVKRRDINDRGRGRTVETQSGGLAVVRAAWGLRRMSDEGR